MGSGGNRSVLGVGWVVTEEEEEEVEEEGGGLRGEAGICSIWVSPVNNIMSYIITRFLFKRPIKCCAQEIVWTLAASRP